MFQPHCFSKHIYIPNSYHMFPNMSFYKVHVSTTQMIFSYALLFMKKTFCQKLLMFLVLCKFETPSCIVSTQKPIKIFLSEVLYKERTVEAYEIVLDPSFVSVSITSTSAKICCTTASSSSLKPQDLQNSDKDANKSRLKLIN